VKVLLLTSARQLTPSAVDTALDQLGIEPSAPGEVPEVTVLATQAPTEPCGVRVVVVPPLLSGVGRVGGRGRAVLVTLAWSTSRVVREAFRGATVVVALDSGTHQAAWLLAQRYRRPAVVAGAAAGRRVIAERDRSAP
jgi:hypothetical protein